MTFKKIDEQGNYLEFPGVTVIANVGNTNQHLWENIHNCLLSSPTLCAYFAPLPLKSYHMTTCNLYTKKEYPWDWLPFMSAQLPDFQKINEQLALMQFNPSVFIKQINFFPALQLMLTLPPDQEKIIQHVADKFGLQNKVPSVFHITLAYGYRGIDTEENFKAIQSEVHKLMVLCQQYDKKIVLSPPQLTFFNNMGQFIPWDGSSNPFLTQQTQANVFGLFTNKTKQQETNFNSSACNFIPQ
jgi:hypothetical protein